MATIDVWASGDVTLYLGDCLEILPTLGDNSADMLVTDPPYGVGYDGGHFHNGDVNIKRSREKLVGDGDGSLYGRVLPQIARVCDGPCYMFYAATMSFNVFEAVLAAGCKIHAIIVWHKTNVKYASMWANYKNRYELLLYFKPKRSTLRWIGPSDENTIWEMKRDSCCQFHPTQKPVAVMARAIGNHYAYNVLDPFMGSGAAGVACVKRGRKFVGIEIEPKYFEIAKKRILAAQEANGND